MPENDICDRTFEYARRIVRVCRTLDRVPGVTRTLGSQLLRSGTSVGANLTEAQSGQSRADFISKCNIALKEVRETAFWLRLISEEKLVPAARLELLIKESDELRKIISTIIVRTKQNSRKIGVSK